MIKKCDWQGCTKAGICRAPKNRTLNEYHYFCKDHAAEYNKNWNYYENMTDSEIEEDWEKQTFGYSTKEKIQVDDYAKFIQDFLEGRDEFDKIKPKKSELPTNITGALKTLELPMDAVWTDIATKYRTLAKQYHPDTTKHVDKNIAARAFAAINEAYAVLKKHFNV